MKIGSSNSIFTRLSLYLGQLTGYVLSIFTVLLWEPLFSCLSATRFGAYPYPSIHTHPFICMIYLVLIYTEELFPAVWSLPPSPSSSDVRRSVT
ncbi:hypothetical protein F4810DRAFT_431981 [Camillea tinctor]|nr:hypothetical protein F4810DRAFT_431981 [Camillea tinctor]